MQDIIQSLDIDQIIARLFGKDVPISFKEKIKLLDINKEEFVFERDISDKENHFFRVWLKEHIQNEIREHLKIQ